MSLPSVRSMPIVTANFDPARRAWIVVLPGDIALPCRDEFDVRAIVAKHAPGSSIRFVRTSPVTPAAAG